MKEQTLQEILNQMIGYCLDHVRSTRTCRGLSDHDLIYLGMLRVLNRCSSGRDHFQWVEENLDCEVATSTFFDALASERRSRMCADVSACLFTYLEKLIRQANGDCLQPLTDLQGYSIYAVDGTCMEHATHATRVDGKYYPDNTVYIESLRTGLLAAALPLKDPDKKRPHEFPALRRAVERMAEQGPAPAFPKGTIIVADRAYINTAFWAQISRHRVYMITRTKENMRPVKCAEIAFDRTDEDNAGVQHLFLVGGNSGYTHYVIDYTDPETHDSYQYMTSIDPTRIKPGVIVHLYRMRWQIETTFNTIKRSLCQQKSWANSKAATTIQSHIILMTHNFLRYLELVLEHDFDLVDRKVRNKAEKRLKKRRDNASSIGRCLPPLLSKIPRITRLSLQFIRTVRNFICRNISLQKLIPRFSKTYHAYR